MINWSGVLQFVRTAIKGTVVVLLIVIFAGCTSMVFLCAWESLIGQFDFLWGLLFSIPAFVSLAIIMNIK